jgi:transcription initiation factor TFIID TATA-box-binding protein
MTEKLSQMYNMNTNNNINEINLSPNITYYLNNSSNKSLLDITSPNNINESLMNNDGAQYPMDDGNDGEPQPETPKMNININSNDQKLNEDINHEDPQKEKNISTETKATTNKVNSDKDKQIEIIPTIQNLVCTAQLNCQLRLREIALQEQNTKYVPKRFSGLIMRICKPIRATSLIFHNGNIVVLGTKTEEDCYNACRKVAKIIKSLNYCVKLTDFKIHNCVGSCDMKFQLNLSKLYNKINEKELLRASFEPEAFHGLIYRLNPNRLKDNENKEKLPNIVFIIYSSGKLIITGGKNRNHIYEAFKKTYPLLYQAKANNSAKGKQ